jgi:hypothetical protein
MINIRTKLSKSGKLSFLGFFGNRNLILHIQRMEEGRLPKEFMKWHPPGRRKRGRPKLTRSEGIRGLMGEKRVMEEDWNDSSNWRKKILLIVNGRRKMWKHSTTC